jgi:hypothetical protein
MTTQTEIQVREIQARAARDEIRRLKAEIERLKAQNLKNVRAYSEELEKRVPPTEIRFINRDGSEAGRIVNLAPPSEQTYCPECGQPGECACLGNWRERAERAEAEVERIACAATGLKQCCEEQRAEVERLRQLAERRMEDVEQARANLRALVEAGDRLVGLHLSYGIPCYEWDEAKRKAGL